MFPLYKAIYCSELSRNKMRIVLRNSGRHRSKYTGVSRLTPIFYVKSGSSHWSILLPAFIEMETARPSTMLNHSTRRSIRPHELRPKTRRPTQIAKIADTSYLWSISVSKHMAVIDSLDCTCKVQNYVYIMYLSP